LQTPKLDSATSFYEDVLGLELVDHREGGAELRAGTRLFFDRGEQMGPILEFLVPDLGVAKDELFTKGCHIVVWEGKGGRCYVRDPFGFLFNLYEDPQAFEQ
jgi:catechol 2,3-dioxygenase-like lactoylglutathione lyase family enzyme